MPAKTSQERFAECVKLCNEKKKKDGKKPNGKQGTSPTKAREEEELEREEESEEQRDKRIS